MANELYFMAFGALVAVGGFALVVYAKGGDGGATIDVFGLRLSLTSAGGILVIFLGSGIFTLPFVMQKQGGKLAKAEDSEFSIVGPRVGGASVRGPTGWLSDTPDYKLITEFSSVDYGGPTDQGKCIKSIVSALEKQGTSVDWVGEKSLLFGEKKFLYRITCAADAVRIIVSGPPGVEVIGAKRLTTNLVVDALNTLQ